MLQPFLPALSPRPGFLCGRECFPVGVKGILFRFVRLQLLQQQTGECSAEAVAAAAPMLHVIFFCGNRRRACATASAGPSPAGAEGGHAAPSDMNRWAARGPLALLCTVLWGLSEEDTRGGAQPVSAEGPPACPPRTSRNENADWPLYLHSPSCCHAVQQPSLPHQLEHLQQQLLHQQGQQLLLHLLVPLLLARSRTFAMCCLWKTTRRPRRLAAFLECMQHAMGHAPPCKLPPKICYSAIGSCSNRDALESASVVGINRDLTQRLRSTTVRSYSRQHGRVSPWGFSSCTTRWQQPRDCSSAAESDSGHSIRSCRMLQPTSSLKSQSNKRQRRKCRSRLAFPSSSPRWPLKGRVRAGTFRPTMCLFPGSNTHARLRNVIQNGEEPAREEPERSSSANTATYRWNQAHHATAPRASTASPYQRQRKDPLTQLEGCHPCCASEDPSAAHDDAGQRAPKMAPPATPIEETLAKDSLRRPVLEQQQLRQEEQPFHCPSAGSSTAASLAGVEPRSGSSNGPTCAVKSASGSTLCTLLETTFAFPSLSSLDACPTGHGGGDGAEGTPNYRRRIHLRQTGYLLRRRLEYTAGTNVSQGFPNGADTPGLVGWLVRSSFRVCCCLTGSQVAHSCRAAMHATTSLKGRAPIRIVVLRHLTAGAPQQRLQLRDF